MQGIIGYELARREPLVGPRNSAAFVNTRPVETVSPVNESPEPIRYGDTIARPARMQKAFFNNVAEILAVWFDEFGSKLWAPTHTAATLEPDDPRIAWGERVNIARDVPASFGSHYILEGHPTQHDYF